MYFGLDGVSTLSDDVELFGLIDSEELLKRSDGSFGLGESLGPLGEVSFDGNFGGLTFDLLLNIPEPTIVNFRLPDPFTICEDGEVGEVGRSSATSATVVAAITDLLLESISIILKLSEIGTGVGQLSLSSSSLLIRG
jgi:hypothetical protein